MEFKDQFMWELVVSSTGKHYMDMVHHLCLHFQRHHFAHGVVPAAAVVVQRKLQKMRKKFTEIPRGMI